MSSSCLQRSSGAKRRLSLGRLHGFVLAALCAVWAPIANAHAMLAHAYPAAGHNVTKPLTRIELDFDNDIDLAASQFQLETSSGQRVMLDKAQYCKRSDTKRVCVLPASPVRGGSYRLIWSVTSADGHPTQGKYVFRVAPP